MSSSASELTKTTEERTEISVETEEVTLYKCPICDQQVTEDELVPVEIANGEHQTVSCEYCANSLFGFEGDSASHAITEAVVDTATGLTDLVSAGAVRALVSLGIGLSVIALVFQQVMTQIPTSGFEDVGAPPAMPFLDILPIIVIAVVLWTVFRMMVVGPRM